MADNSEVGLSDTERAAIQILIDRELTAAVSKINEEIRMKFFDTSRISRHDLTKALDQGDIEAGTTDRKTSFDGQIMKVDWAAPITEKTEIEPMSVSGLAPGILQAKLAELKQRGQERLLQGAAKIEASHTEGLAKIDAAVDEASKRIDAEIDSALHEFAISTNGGPV